MLFNQFLLFLWIFYVSSTLETERNLNFLPGPMTNAGFLYRVKPNYSPYLRWSSPQLAFASRPSLPRFSFDKSDDSGLPVEWKWGYNRTVSLSWHRADPEWCHCRMLCCVSQFISGQGNVNYSGLCAINPDGQVLRHGLLPETTDDIAVSRYLYPKSRQGFPAHGLTTSRARQIYNRYRRVDHSAACVLFIFTSLRKSESLTEYKVIKLRCKYIFSDFIIFLFD